MSGNSGSTSVVDGVRVDRRLGADRQRRGAALDAVAILLVVDAPQLVGDELAVVGVERRVGVEVDDRRHRAVLEREQRGVDRDLALLQVPVRPHRLVACDVAVRLVHVDRGRQLEHRPEVLGPRARGRRSARRTRCGPGSSRRHATEPSPASSKPVTSTPVISCAPVDSALACMPATESRLCAKPPLCSCSTAVTPLRPPVREELLHVRVAGRLARQERRVVADRLLALVDSREVGLLRLRADRHVADRVVGVGGRVRFPDLDAGLHQLLHRGLEVVVAHDAAGDARGAGAWMRLLEDDDVGARALAARGQLLGRGDTPSKGRAGRRRRSGTSCVRAAP